MSKRCLLETSPEHQREEKRRIFSTSNSKPAMESTAPLTNEALVQILRENNKELYRELPSKADFQGLHAELTGLKTKYDEMSAKVIELERRNNALEDQMDRLMQKNMETNVVVHLPVESNVDMKERAKSVCASLIGAAGESAIEHAHSISSRDTRTAMIIVKMKTRSAAWTVLRNTNSLRSTQIHIHKDLPYNVRRKKANLLPISRFLHEKFPLVKPQLRDDKLFIMNKLFTWNFESGLKSGSSDPMEVLRTIYGANCMFSSLETFMNEVHGLSSDVNNVKRKTSKVPEVGGVSSDQVSQTAAVSNLGPHTSNRPIENLRMRLHDSREE